MDSSRGLPGGRVAGSGGLWLVVIRFIRRLDLRESRCLADLEDAVQSLLRVDGEGREDGGREGQRQSDGGGRQGGRRHADPDQRHRRSEEHTSELQSRRDLVCRLLLEKKKQTQKTPEKY